MAPSSDPSRLGLWLLSEVLRTHSESINEWIRANDSYRTSQFGAPTKESLGIFVAHAVDRRAIPSRNADRALSYRGNTVSLAASGARSGWPASNGGSGLYSRPSWIA